MDFEMVYDLVMISVTRYFYVCNNLVYSHRNDSLVPKAEYEPNSYWRGAVVQFRGNTAISSARPRWRIS